MQRPLQVARLLTDTGDAGTAPTARAKLVTDGISKRYGSIEVLHPTHLTIAAGELLTVLGPSGSGKTTLLQIICGLVEPTAGRLLIDGKDQTHTPAHRRDIGVVFQNYALFPHLTVAENVAFPLQMRRLSAQRVERRRSRPRAGHGGPRRFQWPLPARAVGRPAAARRTGTLPGLSAGADPDGRTARRARPQAARGDADRDQAAAPRNRRDDRVRDPRPGRGAGAVRPHLPDERRPHRADRHAAGHLRAATEYLSSPTSSASPTCCAARSARAAIALSPRKANCRSRGRRRVRRAHWLSGRSIWPLASAAAPGCQAQ